MVFMVLRNKLLISLNKTEAVSMLKHFQEIEKQKLQ